MIDLYETTKSHKEYFIGDAIHMNEQCALAISQTVNVEFGTFITFEEEVSLNSTFFYLGLLSIVCIAYSYHLKSNSRIH